MKRSTGVLPRSEVEVAADTVWRLVERRVIRSDSGTIRTVAAGLGISVDDVRLASIRQERRGYRAPRADTNATLAEPIDVEMQEHGRRRLGSTKPPKNQPDDHWCNRHDGGTGAWLPADQFAIKNHRTGSLKSMCRPCMTEYQRERYLTIEKAGHLAELRFRLIEGDATVGDSCSVCRELLAVGDEVLARGALVHAGCAQGVLP